MQEGEQEADSGTSEEIDEYSLQSIQHVMTEIYYRKKAPPLIECSW